MKTVYLNAAYFPSVELLSAVATAAILLYGGNQVVDGNGVTIGVLASFVFYLQTFFDPIQQLSQLYTTYQAGMAALDKVFELLDEEPDLQDAPDAIGAAARARRDPVRGRLLLATAATTSRSATCDLDVPPGQTVALVGATGAGKSTFAKLIARFYDPTSRARARGRARPARRHRALAALAARDRAAGGLPVLGHDPRQHRLRARRRDRRGRRRGRPRGRARTS